MIMFRTPVRSATIVTTDGERNGQPARVLGDRAAIRTHKVAEAAASNTINRVQTNVDIEPTEPASVKAEEKEPKVPIAVPTEVQPEPEVKKAEPVVQVEKEAPAPAPVPVERPQTENDLSGRFLYETIRDGTIMPGNNVFEQTWVLRNDGEATWPAGCSVKFVGGDYMGHVDSKYPADIAELISASESTVCYNRVAPGEEFPFTVLLRTPARPGNLVSYWRLTSPSGHKFGDRLWCDVSVREACPKAKPEVKPETEQAQTPEVETPVEEVKKAEDSQASSQMIFPKLEKESPVSSIHEAAPSESVTEVERVETKTESGDEDWDISEDGFMTDEEYDILDASDEEYLEEQKKQLAAK
jgi:next-to-BRCA1 protein 1